MHCTNCGKEATDRYCSNCGALVNKTDLFNPNATPVKTKKRKTGAGRATGCVGCFVIAILLVIIVPLVVGSINMANNSTSSNVGQAQQTQAIWYKVITFEGNSIKNTQTFHISGNDWAISWATAPGEYGDMNFQIYVYDESGIPVDVAANVIGEGSDISYMRGSGNYYLTINTAQNYKIEIQEYK